MKTFQLYFEDGKRASLGAIRWVRGEKTIRFFTSESDVKEFPANSLIMIYEEVPAVDLDRSEGVEPPPPLATSYERQGQGATLGRNPPRIA